MTMHPSLGGAKHQRHRNIMKRHERLKYLMERDRWQETDSVFGLPKIKNIKMKIRKEKKEEAVAAEGAPAAAGAAASGPAGASKPAGGPDRVGAKPEAKGKAESKGK